MKIAPRQIAVLIAALAFALPTAGNAATIFQDAFSYPNGNLVGQGGWQAHSGAAAKPVQVLDNRITLQQSAGSGEDVNRRWFTSRGVTDTTYASFNLKVAPNQVLGTGVEYIAHFRPFPDTLNFRARVYVSGPGDATHYTLGLSTTSSGTSPVVNWPSQLECNVTYKIVTRYDGATGTSTLWVDPANEASASISSTHATADSSRLESYAFRQASPTGATFNQQIHDLTVGTKFADVTTYGKPLPAMDQRGLALLAMSLLLGGAVIMMVRRRGASIA